MPLDKTILEKRRTSPSERTLRVVFAAMAALCLSFEAEARQVHQRGPASYYGPGFHGRTMANGRPFRQDHATIAHRRLPLGTVVEVRNPRNGRRVVARVTDRGPYVGGRIADLSRGVATVLGTRQQGVAVVELTVLGRGRGG